MPRTGRAGAGSGKVAGGGGRAPDGARPERDQERTQPTQTEPPKDTLGCTRLHTHPASAAERQSDLQPQAHRGKHSSCTDPQGLDRLTGTLQYTDPCRDTHQHPCRERLTPQKGAHTSALISVPECTKHTRDGTCTGTGSPTPTLPRGAASAFFPLDLGRRGRKHESRGQCGRVTFPSTHTLECSQDHNLCPQHCTS